MQYRAEIDGLRALAVIPVILFHAGFALFSGGFVGVDIFFVISGYLITTILIDDIENKRFSITHFYERRARRILPALFVVMLACLPFAWLWMLPSQMVDFSKSFIAISLFVSNILFWRESGYFAAASEEKPLLHTWSLAVEDQYYLLFPLFLLLLWRFGKNKVFWAIIVIATLSLLTSEWGWRYQPSANFFLTPTRAWELLSGSITAFIANKNGIQKNNTLAFIGLVAVLFSVFAFDETTPFPSLYTLIPIIGVVLIILFAEKQTFTARILSNQFFTGIGLMSYSAYLWHQPLLAFMKLYTATKLNLPFMWAAVFCSLLLGYISWKFIEVPFRNRSFISSKKIIAFSIFGVALMIAIGTVGIVYKGFPKRLYFEENANLEAIMQEWGFSDYPNHALMSGSKNGFKYFGELDAQEASVLIGDSHAYQYWNSFGEYFKVNQTLFKKDLLLVKSIPLVPDFKQLKLPENTTKLTLSYFWGLHLGNPNINGNIRCCGNGLGGSVGHPIDSLSEEEIKIKLHQIKSLLLEAQKNNIETTIVLDNPFGEELHPKSLVNVRRSPLIHISANELTTIELTKKEALRRSEPTRSYLINLAKDTNSKIIDPIEFLCNDEICPKFGEAGHFLYKDYDHLSLNAVKNNSKYIYDILK